MNPRLLFLILAITAPLSPYAQTKIDRSIPIRTGQKVSMHFDYPDLIKVSTWEGSDIVIQGTVSINGGENDDAFQLENSVEGNIVRINSFIKDLKQLPQRITVVRGGEKIMFHNKEEWKKYQAQHGGGFGSMSWGPSIDIELEIRVPRGIDTEVHSTYGMVEVTSFSGPLAVESTYGGVDASLEERAVGELKAETSYGQIYTDFQTKFSGEEIRQKDFHSSLSARPGQGPRYSFSSRYGNVYLRRKGS